MLEFSPVDSNIEKAGNHGRLVNVSMKCLRQHMKRALSDGCPAACKELKEPARACGIRKAHLWLDVLTNLCNAPACQNENEVKVLASRRIALHCLPQSEQGAPPPMKQLESRES